MAKGKTDWLTFAHLLDRERELIQDALPGGVSCSLSLDAYGHGAEFTVGIRIEEEQLHACGRGRTPAKALEAAKLRLRELAEARMKTPRLVASETKAINAH